MVALPETWVNDLLASEKKKRELAWDLILEDVKRRGLHTSFTPEVAAFKLVDAYAELCGTRVDAIEAMGI